MTDIKNLFDEDLLLSNLKGASYFILIYEHFEDNVISAVKDYYSEPCGLDGKDYYNIDDDYIKALKEKIAAGEEDSIFPYEFQLRQAERARELYIDEVLRPKKESDSDKDKDRKRLRGSLNWMQENGVLSEEDVSRIFKIRIRRNGIVHELLKVLSEGLSESDAGMIVDLLALNHKINGWHFREIDMPVMGYDLPKEMPKEDVLGGDDVILNGLFRILFLNEGAAFKEEMKKIKNTLDE